MITQTTLSVDLGAHDQIAYLTSTADVYVGTVLATTSGEFLQAVTVIGQGVRVLRGQRGTPAVSASVGSTVFVGNASDFSAGFVPPLFGDQNTVLTSVGPAANVEFDPGGGGGLSDVNLTEVDSLPVKTGHGTASGTLRVELPTDGTGVIAGVTTVGSITNPVTVSQSTAANLNATVVGTGTFAVQATLAAGSAVVGKVSIDQTTPGTTNGVQVNAALPAGTNAIGKLAANSGVDIGDVDVTSISAGANLIGDVGIQPRATNGLSTMNATSSDGATALTNSAQVIKASAGKLYGYFIYNPNSSAQFVQFYNTAAASVTVGTTAPLFMLTIPASSGANLMSDIGITFSNAGWSWAATSTAGGNGAPATALDAVAWYA